MIGLKGFDLVKKYFEKLYNLVRELNEIVIPKKN